MRVIGYRRVSTTDQEHGIDAQRTAILADAVRRGWTVTWLEDSGRSGKDIDRPGIQAALATLRARECDALVESKLDRLSRSLPDFARLLEIAGDGAQWERETIGLRTKEAVAAAKAKGVKVGRPASQDPKVIRRIRRARAAGHTYRAIADRLNRDAVPLPGGGERWHAASVRLVSERAA